MNVQKKKAKKETEILVGDFDVEAIVGKKMRYGKPFYRVKWEGYPESENTWEPVENLTDNLEQIENFEAALEPKNIKQGKDCGRRSSSWILISDFVCRKRHRDEGGTETIAITAS